MDLKRLKFILSQVSNNIEFLVNNLKEAKDSTKLDIDIKEDLSFNIKALENYISDLKDYEKDNNQSNNGYFTSSYLNYLVGNIKAIVLSNDDLNNSDEKLLQFLLADINTTIKNIDINLEQSEIDMPDYVAEEPSDPILDEKKLIQYKKQYQELKESLKLKAKDNGLSPEVLELLKKLESELKQMEKKIEK